MSVELRAFVRLTQDRLAQEEALRASQNGTGSARSWEDYRYRCGRIDGLRDAREFLDEALRLYFNDDDDEANRG